MTVVRVQKVKVVAKTALPAPHTVTTILVSIYAVKYVPIPHSLPSEVAVASMVEQHAMRAAREMRSAIEYLFIRIKFLF